MAEPLPAEHRLGRYEILRMVRRHGDGVDYEARVVDEDRPVLIREYLPEGLAGRASGDTTGRSRGAPPLLDAGTAAFLARFRALQRVRHAAVVRVEESMHVGGTACAVMEHVAGDTLSARLDEEHALSPQALSDILHPLLDGLEAMHAADVLHGAIEPACIVVRDDGSAVLGGFGPAPPRRAGPRQAFGAGLPESRQRIAPGYTPLEGYSRRGHLGPWTDVYALGAVLYRCVTGEVPEDAPARAVADDMRPAIEAGKGTQKRSVLLGIDRALSLRVADRPQSVAVWRSMLTPSGTTQERPAQPRARGARGGARPAGSPPPTGSPPRARGAAAGKHRWVAPAAAVLTMGVLTWVDTQLLRTDEGESTPERLVRTETVEPRPSRPDVMLEGVADALAVSEPDDEAVVETVDAPPESESRTMDVQVVTVEDRPDVSTSRTETVDAVAEPSAEADVSNAEQPAPATAPDESPARAVAVVERPAVAVSVASLTLQLAPPDASVRFPDAPATTYRPGMELPRGTYRIEVTRPGHLPKSRTVMVAGATRLAVALDPEPHPFAVSTVPAGAEVRFAGQEIAYTPGMLLPPGGYVLTVSMPGYETWEQTVLHGQAPTEREVHLALSTAGFADRLASGGAGPLMVIVPTGRFRMGCVSGARCFNNELPVLDVDIASRFALSKHEITFAEYDKFADAAGAPRPESGAGTARGPLPAVNVSWADAAAYVAWLSAATGRPYRLPTEAEWEYAARAGQATAYSWGADAGEDRANCAGCGRGAAGAAVPVGRFAPNAWGLHDMHGNVWEWTLDCPTGWRLATHPRADLTGGSQCSQRVRRGGSFAHSARRMRAASRDITNPELRSANTGFRVLLELP
ncbi:MAG: SUMF1/EgtB/PvdO family nonheme iron enzyme [Gammaproteobacteria bacterium]|nr:SUMF1/EgtB/PvdO family nonheme iron enzyme [Gammaproteobacteria bacterium]